MSEEKVKETDASVPELVRPRNECILVDKIYDWVLLETDQIQEIPIPVSSIAIVEEAMENQHPLLITGTIELPDGITTSIASIIRKKVIVKGRPVEVGCAQILKTVTVNITVYDLVEEDIILSFSSTFQILERAGLCFPEPFTSDNVIINISSAEAVSLSSIPVNGNLIFEIGICQELQVTTQVSLEVLASFCQPRDNTITCDTNLSSCIRPTFPEQCPIIFPGN